MPRGGSPERLNGSDYAKYVDKWYRLTSDIDCEGETVMLGGVHEFTGDFNGAGHKISNVRYGTYSYTGLGTHDVPYTCKALFPKVKNAEIHNLEVVYDNNGNTVYNSPKSSQYILFGGIAGYAAFGEDAWGGGIIGWCYEGVFSNLTRIQCCCAIGDIIDANSQAYYGYHTTRGSITGNNNGNIVNCSHDTSTTAGTMNGYMSSIPTVRVPYLAQWTGSGSSLNLDF